MKWRNESSNMRPIWLISLAMFASVVEAQNSSVNLVAELYQRGDFPAAVTAASRVLTKRHADAATGTELLVLRSSAYRLLGDNDEATADLAAAQRLARRTRSPALLARVLLATASIELASGKLERSSTLSEAETLVASTGDVRLAAELNAAKAEWLERQGRIAEAAAMHRTAGVAARAADGPLLELRSLNGCGRALLAASDVKGAWQCLSDAAAAGRHLPPSWERDAELIRTGVSALSVKDSSPDRQQLAREVLELASASAEAGGNWLNASHAWGNLGLLRERTGSDAQAAAAAAKATYFAGKAAAPDPLYRWEWLHARLTAAAGRTDEAMEEYARAVDNLHEVRRAYPANSSLSFRGTETRLYFEYVDLLLRKAAHSAADTQQLLRRARDTIERFKRAELADYFHDECVDALQAHATALEDISHSALVVYPIPLSDRLEIIFGSADSGLHRVAVPVGEEELTREVRNFRALLEKRTTNEYRIAARKLYAWLIEPFLGHQAMATVDTLVFVPDGVLRLIPFAALHDGRGFLISRFAVVVTPSLALADARPMRPTRISMLAGGLSTNVAGLANLPGVKSEVAAIADGLDTKVLLDRRFTSQQIERELRTGRYGGLHVASHAVISPNAEESYLLTADGKLTMNRLGEIVAISRFGDQRLELLFLSGCETAVGDDRAALGLAGVALRAGAKSAVASLWHVNDDATSQMVARFYQLLGSGVMSKARALQEVQKEMLQHTWYSHPGYWSPFLLINNWL